MKVYAAKGTVVLFVNDVMTDACPALKKSLGNQVGSTELMFWHVAIIRSRVVMRRGKSVLTDVFFIKFHYLYPCNNNNEDIKIRTYGGVEVGFIVIGIMFL